MVIGIGAIALEMTIAASTEKTTGPIAPSPDRGIVRGHCAHRIDAKKTGVSEPEPKPLTEAEMEELHRQCRAMMEKTGDAPAQTP